jgi:hypothetical protein
MTVSVTVADSPFGPVASGRGASSLSVCHCPGSSSSAARASCGVGKRALGSAHDHGATEACVTTSSRPPGATARAAACRTRSRGKSTGESRYWAETKPNSPVGKGAGQVVPLEVDQVLDTRRNGVGQSPLQGGGGHVDSGHPPAEPSQPDRVTALGAPEVQHAIRRQRRCHVDQDRIGPPAPHSLMSPVVHLPELLALATVCCLPRGCSRSLSGFLSL